MNQLKKNLNKNHIILDARDYPTGYNTLYLPKFLSKNLKSVAKYSFPSVEHPGIFVKIDSALTYYDSSLFNFDKAFSGKLYVLIDGQTISQQETVCMIIKTYYPNAVFIGQTTAGTNGDITGFINLPGNMKFTYTSIDFHFANGTQIQRNGIKPDIEVHETIEGIEL